jgi:Rhodopirellula transposase DDE domain
VHDTAGDPISGLKWSRRTTQKIAEQLSHIGIDVSASTVARLLKSMGFSLRSNRKSISYATSPQRNEQFEYIAHLRKVYAEQGQPIISVDTKKKELVGQFKNAGTSWEQQPTAVNDHDFRSQAAGIAVPYGIYECLINRGNVYVGTNAETPEFATESIARWWQYAEKDYARTKRLLILADGGGANGVRCRAWKAFVQIHLADRFRLPVTVCHYPPGTSKWNPIEHRLFSEISKNWRGKPLDSYETIVKYIRTTKTATGLRVRAQLVKKGYKKGIKISKVQFSALSIERHDTLSQWNYTLLPR